MNSATDAAPARRTIVVGAGIAGLAAAYDLSRAGGDVVVLDPADRAGGKLRTSDVAGLPLDESADTFLARVPWAIELCRDLGLEPELISPSVGAAGVVVGGQVRRLPTGLVLGVPTDLDALAASGLLSPAGLARVAEDAARPAGPPPPGDPALAEDASVGAVVRARLGDEAFEVLVDPLLSGVNAGRADELSAALGAAQLLAAARRDASLVRGARAVLPAPTSGPPAPVFHAIPGGMVRLVDALRQAIGADRIHLGVAATGLHRNPDGSYTVELDDGTARPAPQRADAVVLAVPAPAAARLLRPHVPAVADGLDALRYASVALVALAFHGEDVPGPLELSGFLVPRREGRLLTACSWSSTKFAHLGADGLVRLRASVGRSDDERFLAMTDDELVAAVRAELTQLMGITAEPVAGRVNRWPAALPQYRPGHAVRVEEWTAALAEALPGVALAGAVRRGLGVPACIASGRDAAALLAR